jgi:hypothetical protein
MDWTAATVEMVQWEFLADQVFLAPEVCPDMVVRRDLEETPARVASIQRAQKVTEETLAETVFQEHRAIQAQWEEEVNFILVHILFAN